MTDLKLPLPSLKTCLPVISSSKIDENDENDEYSNSDEENNSKENSVTNKAIDANASFFATFIDGSSFRYLVEYLRYISSEGTFVFTKDCISYQKGDDDNTIFNEVKLKTYELIDYDFSSFNTEITATINLADLRNKTSTVGKKEQLDIYRRPDEPYHFYAQVRSQEKTGDNPVLYCMSMKSENITIYELPVYSRGKHNPNCTIYQNDFSKLCKALIKNKCSYVEFIGFEKGLIVKGFTNDNKVAMVKEYGKCRQSNKSTSAKSINIRETIKPEIAPPRINLKEANEIERFKVHINNIKALSKINGFSNSGSLKVYIEEGMPMKLSVNIGTFGRLNILIRSLR